ncbi:hypothetical protein Fmac_032082 [Flemingia macrophylla]|uniref:Uncharacterized protein n=1 Tax=Flemingia macrophylla TaxID=520843 RepID=A0ABD1L3W7_9FABA
MATEAKSSSLKCKSGAPDGSSKKKLPSDAKMKSVSAATKSEAKSKSSSSSKTVTKTATKVREKKVYSLPGQKHDPPEQKEPLRIFYESLSKQIPTSEMAEFWLMEYGMLSPDRAKRAFEKKQQKQKEVRTETSVKPSKSATKTETSQKQQQPSKNGDTKTKKKITESDYDDDFILSHKRKE